MTVIDQTPPPGPVAAVHGALRRRCCPGCWRSPSASSIIPVSLQIFSRYTELIPSYIWTEEMARFLFIWTIMIGAMIGVRESTHFEVDVWPQLPPRGEAVARLLGRLGVLALRLVFVWAGIEFTRLRLEAHLRAGRPAALAHPRRLAGDRASPGSSFSASRCSTTSRSFPGELHDRRRAVAGNGGAHPVRLFFLLHVPARAGRVRARRSPACRSS